MTMKLNQELIFENLFFFTRKLLWNLLSYRTLDQYTNTTQSFKSYRKICTKVRCCFDLLLLFSFLVKLHTQRMPDAIRRLFLSHRGNIIVVMTLHLLVVTLICSVISLAFVKQEEPDDPRGDPAAFEFEDLQDSVEPDRNISALPIHRSKRQWGCPNACFSPCTHYSFPFVHFLDIIQKKA